MKKGWTVLFFIYIEDSDTSGYARKLIAELKKIKPSDHLTLLIYESRYIEEGTKRIEGRLFELESVENRVRRVERSVKDYGEVNPGNKSVLKNALKSIMDEDLLREKFLLFTWDHGVGFGIFDAEPRTHSKRFLSTLGGSPLTDEEDDDNGEIVTNDISFKVVKSHSPRQQFSATEARTLDERGGGDINMLTADEINDSLKVIGRKTNLVIMMNCWMQMLETGYDLSESVNILVAAETIFFFVGYDYTAILHSIIDDPSIGEKKLAEIAVNTIESNFNEEREWAKHTKDIVVSAVDLEKSAPLVKALSAISETLEAKVSSQFDYIQANRKASLDLTLNKYFDENGEYDNSVLGYMIDCVNFFAQLKLAGLVPGDEFDDLRKAADDFVLYCYAGKEFKKYNPVTKTRLGNGFSIFHPETPGDFGMLYYYHFYVQKKVRLAETPWYEYLKSYYRGSRASEK